MKGQKSQRSIRHDLQVPILSIVGLALILFLVVIEVLTYVRGSQVIENRMNVMGYMLGNRSIAALTFNSASTAQEILHSLRFDNNIQQACLYDQNQKLFASYYRDMKANSCLPNNTDNQSHSRVKSTVSSIHVFLPIYQENKALASITLEASKQPIFAAMFRLFVMVLIIIGASFIFIYLLIKKIFKNAFLPLEKLTDVAETISDNPRSGLRAIKQSHNEVGALVDMFNNMLDNIDLEHSAVEASENRFRTLTEHSPVGVYQRDQYLNFTFINHRLATMIGEQDIQTLSHTHWLEGILQRDRQHYLALCNEALHTLQPCKLEYRFKQFNQDQTRVFIEHLSPLISEKEDIHFVGTVIDITDLKQAQMELENLAFFDPLTQLPNRRYLKENLSELLAQHAQHHQKLAVLFVDLDDFKKINDTFGHDAGDVLLQQAAERLNVLTQAQDALVARMGGDEFMLLIPNIQKGQDIEHFGKQLIEAFKKPFEHGQNRLHVRISAGVAFFPQDGQSEVQLLKSADIALYAAKRGGRNQLCFYSHDMDQAVQKRHRMETQLRKALLQQDHIHLNIQAQYASAEDRIISAECLTRWHDPELGQVSPAEFIQVAEETGLIIELGEWVLHQTGNMLETHGAALKEKGVEKLAINLSAKQFYRKGLLKEIQCVTEQYNLSPEQLEFELTESILIDDMEHSIIIMRALRDLGFSLAIDDFGTGYSSLSYLKRLPITSLKIDRTFVSDIPHDRNDMEISSAIIAMAHKLDLMTIAEGVETEAQKTFLLDQGCDLLQGYLISRPQQVTSFLSDH